jgi:hypothetical protein
MSSIFQQRMTAAVDSEFVVFLIGMRVNRPWKIHRWLPVMAAMPRMLRELSAAPELGFLGAETWFGRTTMMVQYWRSFEHLHAYAHAREHAHLPAWTAFNRQTGNNGDVGIWHETYQVGPGRYECMYVNMPRFGLARVGEHLPAVGGRRSAKGRMAWTG